MFKLIHGFLLLTTSWIYDRHQPLPLSLRNSKSTIYYKSFRIEKIEVLYNHLNYEGFLSFFISLTHEKIKKELHLKT